MRTLPDPFGIPGPSFMPSLSARTIPKFYPPDSNPHGNTDPNPSGRRLTPCARQPNGKEQPAFPRVARRGTARPAEESFHSASLETKHRNSTTILRAGQSQIMPRMGPARDVPAPPSARGVRTWEGRSLLRPTEQQPTPNMRSA